MRGDKKSAIKLRRSGKSYTHISQALHIPKSTLSEWFSNEEWSSKIKQSLQEKSKVLSRNKIRKLHVARQIKLEEFYIKAEKEAKREFSIYKNNSLFSAGVMLYWGEGDKKFSNGIVRISNTDPLLIKTFRNFLLKFSNFSLEKIKGWILLYPDLSSDICLNYWSREAGILRGNFIKSTLIVGRHKTNRSPYGTCTIYVTNKYLKKKILKWIDLFKIELIRLK